MAIDALRELESSLDWIEKTGGVHVTISGMVGGLDPQTEGRLLKHTWHINPYCLHIKSNRARWDACIRAKEILFRALSQAGGEPVCGYCPFGVYEKSWPVLINGSVMGAVSAGMYRYDEKAAEARRRRSMRRVAPEGEEQAEILYREALLPRGKKQIEAECMCAMLAEALSGMAAQGILRFSPEARRTHTLIAQALDFIRSHVSEPFTVPEVAAFCNISESHLQHLFRRMRERSVIQSIVDIRMERARQLLGEGRLTIAQVAENCGFTDPNYFSAVFSSRHGMPPSRYKQARKESGHDRK